MNATTVCDVMTWTSLTIRPDCPALTALDTLVAAEAAELFVVDGDGRFLGIVTDYEMLKADLTGSLDDLCAEQLMQRRPMTLSPDHSLGEAAKLFRERSLSCVPVIRDERLLGMIQRRDVLRWMSAQRDTTHGGEIQAPKFLQSAGRTMSWDALC